MLLPLPGRVQALRATSVCVSTPSARLQSPALANRTFDNFLFRPREQGPHAHRQRCTASQEGKCPFERYVYHWSARCASRFWFACPQYLHTRRGYSLAHVTCPLVLHIHPLTHTHTHNMTRTARQTRRSARSFPPVPSHDSSSSSSSSSRTAAAASSGCTCRKHVRLHGHQQCLGPPEGRLRHGRWPQWQGAIRRDSLRASAGRGLGEARGPRTRAAGLGCPQQ